VRDAILGAFEANMSEVDLVVPYDAGSAIGEVHKVHVIPESYEAGGVHYRVRAAESAIERIGQCCAGVRGGQGVLRPGRRRGFSN
jgi:hypothetical protein